MKTKDNREVMLVALQDEDRELFVRENQEAFKYGATQEFGMRDNHFEEEGEIISRETIIHAIDGEDAEAYRIVCEGEKVGGVVIRIEPGQDRGELELLFVSPHAHSKGIGYAAWVAVEELHPEIKVWETVTPYFEKRNIHFYVNRCGFHIVEFFNIHHPDPNDSDMMQQQSQSGEDEHDGMFRFQKILYP
jgi:GNAT superfamily N-acetyltransferase